MKKHQPQRLDTVLRKLARSWGQETQYLQAKIINDWDKIAGKVIANHTTKINFSDKKLFIIVDSAVVKNEMMILRSDLKKRINNYAGYSIIDDVIILS